MYLKPLAFLLPLIALPSFAQDPAVADQAKLARNFSVCKAGLSEACKRNLLTAEQLTKVQEAEKQRNFANCKNGKPCNKNLLTEDQKASLTAAGLNIEAISDPGLARSFNGSPGAIATSTASIGSTGSATPANNPAPPIPKNYNVPRGDRREGSGGGHSSGSRK